MIGLTLKDLPFVAGTTGAAVTLAEDDFDSYTDGVDLGGLNGGTGWNSAYVSRSVESALDNFDSYADTADLNGLNGGDNWNAAYVSHS